MAPKYPCGVCEPGCGEIIIIMLPVDYGYLHNSIYIVI